MSDFKEFFSRNAESYAKSSSHRSGEDLRVLIDHLAPETSDMVLDLAAGTGFTSLALSKAVSRVVAYDGTPQMLEQAKKLAGEQGIDNVDFVVGDVTSLPFEDGIFDILTCRRAAHHFADKGKFLSEAFRVTRKGGRFGLVDIARPEHDGLDLFNTLERIRDPSHVGAETVSKWKILVEDAGFVVSEILKSEEEYSLERWLSPVKMDSARGKSVNELINTTDTESLEKSNINRDRRTLLKERLILIAEKPV